MTAKRRKSTSKRRTIVGGKSRQKPRGKKTFVNSEPASMEKPLQKPMRLNRYIAHAGIAARRKADLLISDGFVKINGKIITELGTKVIPGDIVEVNGKLISPRVSQYYLVNKPGDCITTTQDERGRKTVMDLLDLDISEKEGLYPVGRLDRHTVGVLLITNDGELANRLLHPRYEINKAYHVELDSPVRPHHMESLLQGIRLEDGLAKADRVTYLNHNQRHIVGIMIHEGRNRQVRRMFSSLGYEVVHLERVSYAGLDTRGIRRGRWRKLTQKEIARLRRLVKLK